MKAKKKELGLGIRALLNSIEDEDFQPTIETVRTLSEGVTAIPLDDIVPNPDQPRNQFNQDQIEELSQSIKTFGVIQPLTLRKYKDNKFQIIAGERRYRAAKLAGLTEVPAYIRLVNDQELLEMALVENIQREDLNPMEIGISYRRLMDECNLTQESLSDRVGKDRSTIANYVRLLKLLPDIQNGIRNKVISMGHARSLAGIDDHIRQLDLFKQIVNEGWSVRRLEQEISAVNKPKKVEQNKSIRPEVESVKNKLMQKLGTRVIIDHKNNGSGTLKILYTSTSQLNDIIDMIQGED